MLVRPTLETPPPPNVHGSYGPQVAAWVKRQLGWTLDDWQEYALTQALRHDIKGDLIARIALISTGRQSGKSIIVRSFADWMLDQGHKLPPFREWTTMLAAAHDAKQARVVYQGVYNDMESTAKLRASVHATRYFGIRNRKHGIDLDTVTSQPGSARGKSAGAILWDEVLTQTDFDMYEVLAPTQSAQRSPIMLMTSTAGKASSVLLRAFYERLKGIAEGKLPPDHSFYGAGWMASDDEVGLDWEELRKANPSLDGGRLTRQAIETEYAVLPRGSWVRERLNRWADERADAPFSMIAWGACRVESGPLDGLDGPYTVAIHAKHDLTEATIAVAARNPEGKVGVEILRHYSASPAHPITAGQLETLVSTFASNNRVHQIVYQADSVLAASFAREAAIRGLPYEAVNSTVVMQACGDLSEGVAARRIMHNDPLLDAEISGASRRMVGQEGAWRWSVTASTGGVTSVIAATLALSIAARAPRRMQIF
jgi:hypothetical protein